MILFYLFFLFMQKRFANHDSLNFDKYQNIQRINKQNQSDENI